MTYTLEHTEIRATPAAPKKELSREQILDGADELLREVRIPMGRAATLDSLYNFDNLKSEDIINE